MTGTAAMSMRWAATQGKPCGHSARSRSQGLASAMSRYGKDRAVIAHTPGEGEYAAVLVITIGQSGPDSTITLTVVGGTLQCQVTELTTRQRQLLDLVADGHTNTQIARRLGITEGTVRKHLENIYRRLGVSSRTAAVTRALFSGRSSMPRPDHGPDIATGGWASPEACAPIQAHAARTAPSGPGNTTHAIDVAQVMAAFFVSHPLQSGD
jgi:DNA-binding CsgD family transcriptional regulator